MDEAEPAFPFRRQPRPISPCGLKQNVRSFDIAANESDEPVIERSTWLAAARLQYAVRLEFREPSVERLPVADIGAQQTVSGQRADRLKRIEVCGVGQFVDIEYLPTLVQHEVPANGRSDEARPPVTTNA